MRSTRRMPMKIVIAALGAAVALSPSASARMQDPVPVSSATIQQSQDLRSPDARDAARQSPQDLRSPDARDAAAAQSSRWQAYDAAVRHLTPAQQAVAFLPAKAAPPASAKSGNGHVDAPIAAGGIVAVLVLGLGSLALVIRRRNAPAVSS
jgi:hypothetical protein